MQITKPFANQGSTYHGSRERRLKCMYTSQLTKKRKTWSDGILKVFFSGGSYQCSLLDGAKLRETVLVSRQLESVEIQALKKNEEIELDFEGYLVTVSAGNPELDAAKIGPPLKLPKFVPPSRFVPPTRLTEQIPSTNATTMPKSIGASKGPYRVSNDELDDIWDCDQPPQKYSAVSKLVESDNAPPAFMVYSGNAATSQQQGNAQKFSSRPTSGPGPSVEATLRLTGTNAPNDASQPALTRFFAPTAPPPARSVPTPTFVAAPTNAMPTQRSAPHHQVPNQQPTDQPPLQGYNSRPPYPSSTASRAASGDQYVKPQADQRNPASSSQYPPSRSHPSSHIESGSNSSNSSSHSNRYAPVPMYEHTGNISTARVDLGGGGFSSRSAPVQHTGDPAQRSVPPQQHSQLSNPPPNILQGSSMGQNNGRHNNNNGAVANGESRQAPVKAAYSTIISSSVWDSD
uniref:5'-3' DNA helicase ZGRF1-like N-terminal domain-containing protein n=1 Tax=Spumella elongata TaxID=89044 RepID=A0A7S3HJN9_9STRA|mmetsp:Transcript_54594/g.95451  ORF Transcript_54594/g.95451 Transcript_54594/m.95451 type:complete len:459 (+) Transcript_54594:81-1457(+)|eukprot:CAMPEP_0184988710 /NCGR_PEP_ID=MMETSP1098-20130426/25278_1 /TAXON_ID=89044 /ORGANISM="Spumella elongata, Strain CCAP 955/1" /LENGTH=458 /DNA_ID=CAMNT_0027513535 /DNA_START=93 /DNA_END=1469 /DNA_ORIENTATION=+